MDRSLRKAFITGIVLIILILVSIVFIDHPLARYINENYSHTSHSQSTARLIETLSGFRFPKYMIGFLAVITGLVVYLKTWREDRAIRFAYVGASYLATRFASDILQVIFLRESPPDMIMPAEVSQEFFLHGSSFPSVFASYFFGWFLPLAFIFPKHKWMLIVPVFAVVLRILTNTHYVGDVLASLAIAVLFTWLFARMFKVKPVM